jgi:hypothetical protein
MKKIKVKRTNCLTSSMMKAIEPGEEPLIIVVRGKSLVLFVSKKSISMF